MQKADDDNHVKRVRFNSSNIDTTFTEKGPDYEDIHRIFVNCAVDDGSDIAELMQYFKNSTGKNDKFPRLSDRVSYFRNSKELTL